MTLFEIFQDAEKVGQKETTKLRAAIGPFPATLVSNVCAVIQGIVKHIPSEELERIFTQNGTNHVEFGTNIHFSFEQRTLVSDDDISSESEDEIYQLNFGYDGTAQAASNVSEIPGGAGQEGASQQWDLSWLRRQVQTQFGESGSQQLGLSVEALCSKLIDDLVSEKTNDELQNEVSNNEVCYGGKGKGTQL